MDSISLEPRKLNFTKLEANYQKAKKSSSKKWMLIWLFVILSIGAILTGYFTLNNDPKSNISKTELASNNLPVEQTQNNSNPSSNIGSHKDQPNNSSENNSQTSSSASPSVDLNIKTVTKTTDPVAEIRSASTSHEDLKSVSDKSLSNTKASTSNSKPVVKEAKIEQKNNTVTEPTDAAEKNTTSTNSTESKNKQTESKSSSRKTATSSPKNSTQTQSAHASNTNVNETAVNNKSVSKEDHTNKKENKQSVSEKNNETNNKTVTPENSSAESAATEKNTNTETRSKETPLKENESTTSAKNETVTASPEKTISSEQTTLSAIDTTNKGKEPVKSVNNPKTNDLVANITPSNSAKKESDHHFTLSTEIVYSNIHYAAKPNDKATSIYNQNGNNFSQLYTNGISGNNYRLLSGAVILGYNYKNTYGINAGVGFFNVETKVNGKAFAQTKTQMVFDHYTYDSLMQITDTVYKVGSTRQVNVVNGDTVEAQDYLNNIRFVTIPLNFSYQFKFSKFGIQPQAGIQYAIPINSNQLIATNPYKFEYSKNKLFFSPRSIFFDLALKLSYNISTNASLYIKQGYFFNNRSIYNVDYVLDYRLKNVYTTFGVCIKLK